MEDNVDIDDFLCEDLDLSIDSEIDTSPQSINIDICNGSPFSEDSFIVLHYNINSITAEGKLEELTSVTSALKVDVLVCT